MENSVQNLLKRKDKTRYLTYLLNLEQAITGSDDDNLVCFETTEVFKKKMQKLKPKDLKGMIIQYLSYLDQETEWLLNEIPVEYQKGFNGPEPELINVPETDFIMSVRIEFERLVEVLNALGITKYNLNKNAQYGKLRCVKN